MATKTKNTETTMIATTAKTMLSLSNKANDFALKTTEKAFDKSMAFTTTCLGLTSKVIKTGLKYSAAHQNMVFSTLETVKGKIVKTPKVSKTTKTTKKSK